MSEPSIKEQRIRNITSLYYSRPEIQKAIFEFSKNREISPRYFEGFGKRPDSFQYKDDIFQLVKKGATSFHCSEELWEDPMQIQTGQTQDQANELRIGWDLLIDIDSKYIDYSKISAQVIIQMLKFYGIKNIGIKFSGSKGFHLLVPWKAFPKESNGEPTKNFFPEYAQIITKYIIEKTKPELIKQISALESPSQYVKDFTVSEKVMPDLILVSPRHLFRMPYSLHEKTALASVVLTEEELKNFELKDADPMKITEIKNFSPECQEGEAKSLLVEAMDWAKQNQIEAGESNEEKVIGKYADFKPLELKNVTENQFPPCVKNILKGIGDGKKRAVFALINFFRSIGMDKEEMEKRIFEWNKKNEVPLKEGYIIAQLKWAYQRKPTLPPNCKEFYQGVAVCVPDNLCGKIKNPVTYLTRKNYGANQREKEQIKKDKKKLQPI